MPSLGVREISGSRIHEFWINAMQFRGLLLSAIDGDSVRVEQDIGGVVQVRVGGVDVPSSGANAFAAKTHIRSWVGRRVLVVEGCCGRPHGEVPGIVTDNNGNNLGKELLSYGKRLSAFPIETGAGVTPALFL